ncbi:MAG TPA: hypothetical protein VFB01_15240 [Burkholderiales bacterium]|nr:hypothetical protein [Burkholderiales bacterium]
MTSAKTEEAGHSIAQLAAAIYVELVGRAFLRVENAASIKPEAAVLAKLSFQLAATFHETTKGALAALGPQNVGYNVQIGDLAGWDK